MFIRRLCTTSTAATASLATPVLHYLVSTQKQAICGWVLPIDKPGPTPVSVPNIRAGSLFGPIGPAPLCRDGWSDRGTTPFGKSEVPTVSGFANNRSVAAAQVDNKREPQLPAVAGPLRVCRDTH